MNLRLVLPFVKRRGIIDSMHVIVVRLFAFHGPNWVYPQPGVLAELVADRDCSDHLRLQLKEYAQQVGVLLVQLAVTAQTPVTQSQITVQFLTPTPALAADLLTLIVAELATGAADHAESEERLWALQQQRRREAVPLRALQLIAEAEQRGVPAWVDAALLRLGWGQRSTQIALDLLRERRDLQALPGEISLLPPSPALPPVIDWAQLGTLQLTVVVGGAECVVAVRELGGDLADAALDFAECRQRFAVPNATKFVLGLNTLSLVRHGTAFETCDACAVLNVPNERPVALTEAEFVQALGVPALLTKPTGLVVLNADQPELLALQPFIVAPIVLIAHSFSSVLDQHCRRGETAFFCHEGQLWCQAGGQRTAFGPAPAASPDFYALLAVQALRHVVA
jgi:hypothetical protein